MPSPENKQESTKIAPGAASKPGNDISSLPLPPVETKIKSKSDKDLVMMLDSNSYSTRQAAAKEINERPINKELFSELLPSLSNHAAKVLIDIVTEKEFAGAYKSFSGIDDKISLAQLDLIKNTLKESRYSNRNDSIEDRLVVAHHKLLEIVKVIDEFNLAETRERIVNSLTERYGSVDPKDLEIISINLQSIAKNNTMPEDKEILRVALADIQNKPWESLSLDRTLIELDTIASNLFAAPTRMSEVEKENFRQGLGLEVLTAKSSFHAVLRNIPRDISSRGQVAKAYRENLDELHELLDSSSPDREVLQEKAKIVNLTHDFLELTDSIVSEFYNSSESKVLQPMIYRWNSAMSKGDIEEMERILDEHSFIADVSTLGNTKFVGPLDCLFIDNILFNQSLGDAEKAQWLEVSRDIQSDFNLPYLRNHEAIQKSALNLIGDSRTVTKNAYETLDIEPLVALKEKFDLYHIATKNYLNFSENLITDNGLDPTIRQAAEIYLGNNPETSEKHLLSLFKSVETETNPEKSAENKKSLDELLDRFRSEFIPIVSLNRIYLNLNSVANSLSSSPIESRVASDAMKNLQEALLSRDQEKVNRAFKNGITFLIDIQAVR